MKTKNLKGLGKIADFKKRFADFTEFFKEKFGSYPTGFQRLWIRRFLMGRSFTTVAPTGSGKTTFGLVTAMWVERKGGRAVLIFPTTILVRQIVEKLQNLGVKSVLGYHSKLKKSEKEEVLQRIKRGDFSVLVISSQFLAKNEKLFEGLSFDFVFVDDVDSVLKASKNIERILKLLGFSESDIQKAYRRILGKEKEELERKPSGVLVVSSATARPRGLRPLLFRELLGFDIGSLVVSSRNVLNVRVRKRNLGTLGRLVELLKDGILVFARSTEEAKRIESFLEGKGIRVSFVEKGQEGFDDFVEGKVNVLIGVSAYYGKLVRGIDLPKRVKFAIFYGTPVFRYPVAKEKAPRFVMKRVLEVLSKEEPRLKGLIRELERAKDLAAFRQKIDVNDQVWERTAREAFSRFVIEDGELVLPDVLTYIQASGRTSRLMRWGLTKGISILMEEDEAIFQILRERLEWLTEEEWKDFQEVDWEKEIKEVELSREPKEGDGVQTRSVLFVVESPTKAHTISGFFGRSSSRRYEGLSVHEAVFEGNVVLFTASRGHVYDLVTDEGFHGVKVNGGFVPVYGPIKRCRSCGYQFTGDLDRCPVCGSDDIDDKSKVLKSLRDLAMEVDEVVIATDPDTEGEKISYDVYQHLVPVNPNIKRVELREITRSEFKRKFASPRAFDEDLVKAQVVRRVQDRWVGFELSRRVQDRFKSGTLSAGRVQSTVLGWIVEREKEYRESEKEFTSITFGGRKIEVEGRFDVDKVEVMSVEESVESIPPLPPFTTDTILSEVSRKMKLSVGEIMTILQDLFELGFITYHRTDSTRISVEGRKLAERIFERMGLDIFEGRSWAEGEEGAHEAIRPAKAVSPEEIEQMMEEGLIKDITRRHIRVYEMIYRRFLQSQAKSPVARKQRVSIKIGDVLIEDETIAEIVDHGWDQIVPLDTFSYHLGEYPVEELKVYKKHTKALYTQATLISEMRKRGIGRPSTYAKTVEVLFKRKYVFEDKYGRLWPTKLGRMVYEFLKSKYEKFMKEDTTRKLEETMDRVEKGEESYEKVLRKMYEEIKDLD